MSPGRVLREPPPDPNDPRTERTNALKLYAISDVHVGFRENLAALETLPERPEDWPFSSIHRDRASRAA